MYIDQSFDGTNWDYTQTFAVTGGTGIGGQISIFAPMIQVRYTNGATLQGYLRIFVRVFGQKTG